MKMRSFTAIAVAVAVMLSMVGAARQVADAQAAALDEVKVTVIGATQLFPLYVMDKLDIGEKYGIKVDLIQAAGPQAAYTMMQTPDFQVGFGAWVTIALMRAQGQPLTNVYSMYSYTNDVIVKADSPLRDFSDLKGKRLGVFGGPTAGTSWLFRLQSVLFFDFDPLEETELRFGAAPLLMGMLEQDELDAILIPDPDIVKLLETGEFRSLGNIGDIWREYTGQDPMLVSVTMNENWAKANPDLARRFVAAYAEALDYLKTHDDIWPELAKAMGVQTDHGARLMRTRTQNALLSKWDPEFIEEQYDFAALVFEVFGDRVEGIPREIPDGTFTFDYLP